MIEYPFKPALNPKSVELASKKDQIANVVDRLINDYRRKELKISKLRDKYDQEVQKELTFHPTINNYIPTPSDHPIKKNITPTCSHQPTINALSALMTQDRLNETD